MQSPTCNVHEYLAVTATCTFGRMTKIFYVLLQSPKMSLIWHASKYNVHNQTKVNGKYKVQNKTEVPPLVELCILYFTSGRVYVPCIFLHARWELL